MNINSQKGFTLYISIVISSAVLLGAYAVSNTLFNQQVQSNTYRESQEAFYVAEAGVECAQHYDVFADDEKSAFDVDTVYAGTINCGDTPHSVNGTAFISRPGNAVIGNTTVSSFEVRIGDACAYVTVNKVPGVTDEGVVLISEIESRGYNVCDPTATRRVERAVRAKY